MAELFGREGGVSHGRGGSMHLFDASRHFMGGYGIVAGQMPLALGVGIRSSTARRRRSCLCLTGEGSMANGACARVAEHGRSLSSAGHHVVVNNLYGMGTTVSESAANPNLWQRGEMYGMHGIKIDGMDVMAVSVPWKSACSAPERAAHASSRPSRIAIAATRSPIPRDTAPPRRCRAWREQDPIERFYRQLSSRIDGPGGCARDRKARRTRS